MNSPLKFEVEDAKQIRVVDPNIHPSLIGYIRWNPALGYLEYDPGDYYYTADDLYMIANYMSKIDIGNPRLS